MSAAATTAANTPYVGLTPYTEEDAPFFFGRERERTLIIANLVASRLTLFYGPSGVGKSSVLRAGVVSHLNRLASDHAGRGGDGAGAPRLAVTLYNIWSDDPIQGLTGAVRASVARALGREVAPPDPALPLDEALDALTRPIPEDPSLRLSLLIILDQFEEFFLYPPKPGERSLADELPQTLNRQDLNANFLISLREDYVASLDRFKGRIPHLFDNTLRIRHLRRDAARDAIFKPVEEYNRRYGADGRAVQIETELAEAVLDQVRINEVVLGDAGRGAADARSYDGESEEGIETSYLQLVMTRIWERERDRGSRALRAATLRRLGGAKSIVRTHVDTIMKNLTAREQEVCAAIFHYLVTPSGTKIAHLPSDLAELAGVDEGMLKGLLVKLTGEGIRILTVVDPPPDRPHATRYEIRHDALAPAILDWRSRFVREQELTASSRKQARERRRKLLIGLTLAGVVLLTGVIGVLWTVASRYEREAREQRQIAYSRELAAYANAEAGADPARGILLSWEAVKAARTDQATTALRGSLLNVDRRAVMAGHTNWVNSGEFSPDGRHVLTASGDATARVWEVATGKTVAVLKGHRNGLFSASFSPDGGRVATASSDHTAAVWDARDGRLLVQLTGHYDKVRTARFSPDGSRVVTASEDNTVHIWDAETGQQLFRFHEPYPGETHQDRVPDARFSPDGSRVVAAYYDGVARIWDAQAGHLLVKMSHDGSMVHTAAFSPDGQYVVTASQDGTARVWDAATGVELARLTDPSSGGWTVDNASFSPDGRLVAAASRDGIARVWDWSEKAAHSRPRTLAGHGRRSDFGLYDVSFSPDGYYVVTAGDDDAARVWEVSTGRQVSVFQGHEGDVTKARFSPDGAYVLTTGKDHSVRLWKGVAGANVMSVGGGDGSIDGVAFSPDGNYFVTSGPEHGTNEWAKVWDVRVGKPITRVYGYRARKVSFSPDGRRLVGLVGPGTVLMWDARTGDTLGPLDISFSGMSVVRHNPDGRYVVMGQVGGGVQLWEPATNAVVALGAHKLTITGAAFNPDGGLLVTGSRDGTARVWEIESRRVVAELKGHEEDVNAVAFSPDGRYVATASNDETARVWEAQTGRLVTELKGHNGPLSGVVFSPDGKHLATPGADGRVRVWETATGKSAAVLRRHTERVMSVAFSPDGRLLASAGGDGQSFVWEWRTEEGRTNPTSLGVQTDGLYTVVFSPSGRSLVVAGRDGVARIFPWETFAPIDDLMKVAPLRAGRELTKEEREKYLRE